MAENRTNTDPLEPINNPPRIITYGSNYVRVITPPDIIIVGACPNCRVGELEDNYPCFAKFCAIAFFPIGVLCCVLMSNKRCVLCNTIVD